MSEQQTPETPQWSTPPQQPAGWGGPGYGGPPTRPIGVTLSALYLIVMGILVTLILGACGIAVGGAVNDLTSNRFADAVGGSFVVFGIIALVIGVLGIAGGAGAMSGAGWARWIGMVASILSILFFGLLALFSYEVIGRTGLAALFAVLVLFYFVTGLIFGTSRSWFAARRR